MVKITKKGNKAWVTFTLAPEGVESAMLSGTWNEWHREPMKVKKSGEFYLTKVLPIDASYEFGYVVNDNEWRCDEDLGCVMSTYGSDNSLLVL